jgi:hypothetical protein
MFRKLIGLCLTLSVVTLVVLALRPAEACDFCGPVNLTLSEELSNSEVAAIVTMVKAPEKATDGQSELTKAVFRIDSVLKGGKQLAKDAEGKFAPVQALYFGGEKAGAQFLLLGIDPPKVKWGGPIPLSKRAVEYVSKLPKLPPEGADRLFFFQQYLEDKEKLLAQDSYDEFAKAPYSEFKELRPRMNREQLLAWINDKEMLNSRKRLYLMMLSVCGQPDDVKMLKEMLEAKPKEGEIRLGIEPVIVAYLTLAKSDGMKLIDELFLSNKKAHYTDMYSAIMALRFMGQEEKPIPRKRILQSFHLILDRPEFADLVIPDLARWEDWSVMDRLVTLFKTAKEENSWVRVPVIQYLMVCPLPKAKEHIAALEKIDAEAVKRANFNLPLGRPGTAPKVPPATDAKSADAAAAKPAPVPVPEEEEAKTPAAAPKTAPKSETKPEKAPEANEGAKSAAKVSPTSAGPKSANPASSATGDSLWLRIGGKVLLVLGTLGVASLVLARLRRGNRSA